MHGSLCTCKQHETKRSIDKGGTLGNPVHDDTRGEFFFHGDQIKPNL